MLINFWNENYSADIMKLCLVSNKDVEDLEENVRQIFDNVENKNCQIKIAKKFNGYQFVIAGASGIPSEKYDSFIENSNIKIVYNQTYNLLNCSIFALVTSGTATLEAALFNTPQIVCYKTNPINYWIARKFVKVKYVSLVNLILNKKSLVELIQKELNFENLTSSLNRLLEERELEKMKNDYIKLKLKLGKPGASMKTARLIFNSIKSE